MEKELLRAHRETRSSSKGEREKTSNENRQKKKEHLARCNASFQPAAVVATSVEAPAEKKVRHFFLNFCSWFNAQYNAQI